MAGRYLNFVELAGQETEGLDYRVRMVLRPSPVLVMAPHGGNIEPYTSEIAETTAGTDFSFYAFEGLKTFDKRSLHIPSAKFDEPRAMAAARDAAVVLTVHGCKDTERKFVCAGGRHHGLRSRLGAALQEAGVMLLDLPGMMGVSPANICNRGKFGGGVQLEISYGLRKHLMENPAVLKSFTEGVRAVLRTAVTG